jgi:PiT family inorganic phosphate transporter
VTEAFHQISSLTPILIFVVVTALIFDFINGVADSANAIATIVSTRVLTPFKALMLAAVLNMIGALSGTAIAKTITKGIIRTDLNFVTPDGVVLIVLCAMLAACLWAATMCMIGMPISGSHSMIGGLSGAAVAAGGVKVLIGPGIGKVLLAMLVSPILGCALGFLLMFALIWIVRRWSPARVNRVFSPLQIVSCSFMAFNHGLNDAQKVMGIITMALVAGGVQAVGPGGEVTPLLWVKIACGVMISLGTAIGGWKVIKTLGVSLSDLAPIHGFAAETAASGVLLSAASLGIPVSTTQTITGAIMGTGTIKGMRAVRWGVGQKIILAWVFTLPSTSVLAGFLYWILAIQFGMVTP